MCSEIDQYSSVLRRMSGEDKDNQLTFPPEKQDDVTPSEPLSENQDSCPNDGDRSAATEEDAGFKTPTDHRIPATTECPPPPQKPRPQPSRLKRKASPPGAPAQFEAEVESIFRQIPDEHKMKKARRDDDKDPA